MKRSRRFRIVLLALMLAVSHVALLSHAAGHFEPALEQCELCFGQSQLLSAIPSCHHDFFVDPGLDRPADQPPGANFSGRHEPAYHQRAPPAPSP